MKRQGEGTSFTAWHVGATVARIVRPDKRNTCGHPPDMSRKGRKRVEQQVKQGRRKFDHACIA
jgi:hypothetical protein